MGLNIPKPINSKLSLASMQQQSVPNPGLSMLNIPGIMPSNITSLQFTNPMVNQQ